MIANTPSLSATTRSGLRSHARCRSFRVRSAVVLAHQTHPPRHHRPRNRSLWMIAPRRAADIVSESRARTPARQHCDVRERTRGISMTTALPIDRPWYRQLLAIAVAMGLVIGLLGLVYLGITGGLTDRIFGDPRIDTWSGDWWWIPFIAAGGLVAAAVRSWLKITDHVPGGVAVDRIGRRRPQGCTVVDPALGRLGDRRSQPRAVVRPGDDRWWPRVVDRLEAVAR